MDTKKYYLVVLYQNVMHLLKRAITICGQYMFYNWLLHRMYFKRSKFSIFLNCTQYQTPGLWQRSVPELNNLSNILFSWLFNSVNVESKIIIIFFFYLMDITDLNWQLLILILWILKILFTITKHIQIWIVDRYCGITWLSCLFIRINLNMDT